MKIPNQQDCLLITGATGFVGNSVLDFLARQSPHSSKYLKIFAHSRQGLWSSNSTISTVVGDLTNPRDLLPQAGTIIHAATPASAVLNVRDPKEMFRLNVELMKQLLANIRRWDFAPVVVFTSSGAVYGHRPVNSKPIQESEDYMAVDRSNSSAYADGKIMAESMLQEATEAGLCRGVVTRLFSFSGEYLPIDRHFALGNFIRDATTSQSITVRSDGSSIRTYLDGYDMAHWLVRAAEVGLPKEIFHIGSERKTSIRELAELVALRYEILTGSEVTVECLGKTSQLDGASYYVPSTTRTRERLGVEESIPLETSIDAMLLKSLKSKQ